MASSVPVAGETFTFGCSAISQADTDIFQAGATIAAGDFQRSINGGAFANLDNTPTVTPAAGKRIQFVISAAETTSAGAGGEIYIVGSDQAGDEWQDFGVSLRVFASNLDALATAAALATIDGIVDAIVVDTGTDIPASIAALNDLSAAELLGTAVEGAYTFSEVLQLMAAVLLGKASGGGTTTVTFRDTGDTADRVTAVVDGDGNRSAVTLNV